MVKHIIVEIKKKKYENGKFVKKSKENLVRGQDYIKKDIGENKVVYKLKKNRYSKV